MAVRKPAAKRQSADLNLTFLVAVLGRFPLWAVWLPQRGQWVAVRARDKGLPSAEAALIWVRASSASQLCAEMQQAERRLQDRGDAACAGAGWNEWAETMRDSDTTVTAMPWPLRSNLALGALPSAVPCARLHAKHVLREWGLKALGETIELIVSELITNSLKATAALDRPVPSPIRLRLSSDRSQVLVEVWDSSTKPPHVIEADVAADGGRGLLLVDTLSARWNWYFPPDMDGKVVWAEVVRPSHCMMICSTVSPSSGHGAQALPLQVLVLTDAPPRAASRSRPAGVIGRQSRTRGPRRVALARAAGPPAGRRMGRGRP